MGFFDNVGEVAGNKEFVSSYLNKGYNLVKVSGFQWRESSTGKFMPVITFEGKPIADADFIGAELPNKKIAKGNIANLPLEIYHTKEDWNDSKLMKALGKDLHKLAKVQSDEAYTEVTGFKGKSGSDFFTYVQDLVDFMAKKELYFWIKITRKERNDKPGSWSSEIRKDNLGTKENKDYVVFAVSEANFVASTVTTDDDGEFINSITYKNSKGANTVNKWEPDYDMKANKNSNRNSMDHDAPDTGDQGEDEIPF